MGKKKGKKTVWKSVKVPKEVHKALKTKASESKQAMHKVITSSILSAESADLAEAAEKIPVQAKNIDKAIWYSLKLVNGVAMYKQALKISKMVDTDEEGQIHQYTQGQRDKLMNTIEQINKRLKINMDDIKELIEKLEEKGDGKTIAKLNDSLKKAMIQIINKVVR